MVASKRLVIGVNPHVSGEMRCLLELLRAKLTLEGLFPSMNSPMDAQVALLHKSHVAVFTFVWLVSLVSALVQLVTVVVRKLGITLIASKAVSMLLSLVGGQQTNPNKHFFTLVTLICLSKRKTMRKTL